MHDSDPVAWFIFNLNSEPFLKSAHNIKTGAVLKKNPYLERRIPILSDLLLEVNCLYAPCPPRTPFPPKGHLFIHR